MSGPVLANGTDPDVPSPDDTTGANIGPPGDTGPANINEAIGNVTNWTLGIAGSLAVLFIIISGIRYVTSAGNQQLQESAKKNLTYAIIGLVIIVLAFVITNAVINALVGHDGTLPYID
ncbi:Mbov_0395 family pilin-like conjugal transfer protein [Patescibacteria group bacterium]